MGLEDYKLAERIENGVAFLDDIKPNWRELIDLSTLDVNFSSRCVVGQVFGDYCEFMEDQDLSGWDMERLGFEPMIEEVGHASYSWNEEANRLWKEEITNA